MFGSYLKAPFLFVFVRLACASLFQLQRLRGQTDATLSTWAGPQFKVAVYTPPSPTFRDMPIYTHTSAMICVHAHLHTLTHTHAHTGVEQGRARGIRGRLYPFISCDSEADQVTLLGSYSLLLDRIPRQVCVCVCVCVRAHLRVHLCLCVCAVNVSAFPHKPWQIFQFQTDLCLA